MSCIQSNRHGATSLSSSFPEFPDATPVDSSLGDWVSFGATSLHSLKVVRLNARVQQWINSELPAPLLLRAPRYVVDSKAGWVSDAGVSQGRRCLYRDRQAKFSLGLQPPSAGRSAALHCLPSCDAVLALAGLSAFCCESQRSPLKRPIVSINSLLLSTLQSSVVLSFE